jgi:hypothetical protein
MTAFVFSGSSTYPQYPFPLSKIWLKPSSNPTFYTSPSVSYPLQSCRDPFQSSIYISIHHNHPTSQTLKVPSHRGTRSAQVRNEIPNRQAITHDRVIALVIILARLALKIRAVALHRPSNLTRNISEGVAVDFREVVPA